MNKLQLYYYKNLLTISIQILADNKGCDYTLLQGKLGINQLLAKCVIYDLKSHIIIDNNNKILVNEIEINNKINSIVRNFIYHKIETFISTITNQYNSIPNKICQETRNFKILHLIMKFSRHQFISHLINKKVNRYDIMFLILFLNEILFGKQKVHVIDIISKIKTIKYDSFENMEIELTKAITYYNTCKLTQLNLIYTLNYINDYKNNEVILDTKFNHQHLFDLFK